MMLVHTEITNWNEFINSNQYENFVLCYPYSFNQTTYKGVKVRKFSNGLYTIGDYLSCLELDGSNGDIVVSISLKNSEIAKEIKGLIRIK